MKSKRSGVLIAILVCASCAVVGSLIKPLFSADRADRVDTQFPDAGSLTTLLDNAVVCSAAGDQFISAGDRVNWAAFAPGFPLSGSAPPQCVGGARDRLVYLVLEDGATRQYALYAVTPGKREATIRLRKVGGINAAATPASFSNEAIGALSSGANVQITTDGGQTWKPSRPLFELPAGFPSDQTISLLKWVDEKRLLVAGRLDSTTLSLFELQKDSSLRRLWDAKLDYPINANSISLSGDGCWLIGKTAFRRLSLDNGAEDFAVPRQNSEHGLAICHDALLVWNSTDLQAIAIKPNKTFVAGRAFPLRVSGAIPLDGRQCMVVAFPGKAYKLDVKEDSLAEMPLRISPPWSKSPEQKLNDQRNDELATQTLIRFKALTLQLPENEVSAVMRDATKKKDLGAKEKLQWAMEEMERRIARHKADGTLPAPRDDPTQALPKPLPHPPRPPDQQ